MVHNFPPWNVRRGSKQRSLWSGPILDPKLGELHGKPVSKSLGCWRKNSWHFQKGAARKKRYTKHRWMGFFKQVITYKMVWRGMVNGATNENMFWSHQIGVILIPFSNALVYHWVSWPKFFSFRFFIRSKNLPSYNIYTYRNVTGSFEYCSDVHTSPKPTWFTFIFKWKTYPSSHSHGSQKWVPPIVVTFQT